MIPGQGVSPYIQAAQTPRSQLLAQALQGIQAQAPQTPAALGSNLGAEAMMQYALGHPRQRPMGQAESPYMKNAAKTEQAPGGMQALGQRFAGMFRAHP